MSWATRVLSLSIRRELAYRASFWIQFFLSSATEVAVAYYVWHSVYNSGTLAGESGTIAGFSFREMLFYTIIAGQAARASRSTESHSLSEDIYSGALNRFLVYPIPLFRYKYVEHVSGQLLRFVQMAACLGAAIAVFGAPPEGALTPTAIAAGFCASLIAGLLHFQILTLLEMFAFWQDMVWSLMTMLRFTVQLLGGALVPIALFPDWARTAVSLTPFPLLVSFPTRCFLGQAGVADWMNALGAALAWALALSLAIRFMWARGSRDYTGTGI